MQLLFVYCLVPFVIFPDMEVLFLIFFLKPVLDIFLMPLINNWFKKNQELGLHVLINAASNAI
jgi:hypothetical protein